MSNIHILFFSISSKFIWTLIDTRRSDHMRDVTAAIAALVIKTTHWPVFFINKAFLSTSKLLTPNMYCLSCKTLVTIYWTYMYLRVNGIWAKSFCPQKMNNRMLFLLWDAFSGSIDIIYHLQMTSFSDVIVIKLTAATKN